LEIEDGSTTFTNNAPIIGSEYKNISAPFSSSPISAKEIRLAAKRFLEHSALGESVTAQEYNDKLEFVAKYGNLGETGFLFQEYEDSFWDWYGDPSPEDLLSSDFPEIDFVEWFKSRRVEIADKDFEDMIEIPAIDLDMEIRTLISKLK